MTKELTPSELELIKLLEEVVDYIEKMNYSAKVNAVAGVVKLIISFLKKF